MSKDPKYNTIAEAVRVEKSEKTGELYLVFKVVDESFKKNIRENWLKDPELEIVDKDLVLKEK